MRMWYNHIHKVEVVGVTHSTHNAKTTTLTQFYSRILGTTNNTPGISIWQTCTKKGSSGFSVAHSTIY